MRPEQRFADADRNPATAYELGRYDGERKAAAAAEVRGEAMTPTIDAEEVVRNCTHLGTGACIGCVADAVAAERAALTVPTHACQLCGERYPARGHLLFDLKGDAEFPGGAKVTCLKCWGRLEEREACAKVAEKKRLEDDGLDCWDDTQKSDYRAAGRNIAAAIRARGEPVYPDGEPLQCQNADAISKIDFAATSKPDDVDYPADHFGDSGPPPQATGRHDGDDKPSADCPACGKNVLLACDSKISFAGGFLFWRCPHCRVMLKEDADQRLRVSPESASHSGDLGGRG